MTVPFYKLYAFFLTHYTSSWTLVCCFGIQKKKCFECVSVTQEGCQVGHTQEVRVRDGDFASVGDEADTFMHSCTGENVWHQH
jgi:hypothetical protein